MKQNKQTQKSKVLGTSCSCGGGEEQSHNNHAPVCLSLSKPVPDGVFRDLLKSQGPGDPKGDVRVEIATMLFPTIKLSVAE
jgi:hypothetical protein